MKILQDMTKQAPLETQVRNTIRKPASNITRQSLEWNPQGKRKVGVSKQTWQRSADAEARSAGVTWTGLRGTSQNPVRCKNVVAALCSPRNQEVGWLVVFGLNATLTAKVISWWSVTHMCFLAFSHQY